MTSKGPQQSKGSGSPIKLEYVLLGAAIVGLAYVSTKRKKMAAEVPPEKAVVQQEGIKSLPNDRTAIDPKAYQAELDSQRAKLGAASALGLTSLDLKLDDGAFPVPFAFVPKKVWCQGGDLDTMKYAIPKADAQEVLISLEPMSGGKGDAVYTSLNQLQKGFDHIFKLKPADGAQSYGLYICADSKKARSCKGKTLTSHDKMSDELANRTAKSPKKDYVFYFQHMILDKNTIETYKSSDFTDGFKNQIGDYLKGQKGVSPNDFHAAWKLSNTTRSVPAEVVDGKILLSLPYNDPRCLGLDRIPAAGKQAK
jgi:hypothetical protein